MSYLVGPDFGVHHVKKVMIGKPENAVTNGKTYQTQHITIRCEYDGVESTVDITLFGNDGELMVNEGGQ
jgi:hypothetical protein